MFGKTMKNVYMLLFVKTEAKLNNFRTHLKLQNLIQSLLPKLFIPSFPPFLHASEVC